MTLSEYAKTWVGKHFAGGAREQCMLFVRHCLTEVDAPIKNMVTNQAVDGVETSYALASSLAGPDCGQIVKSGYKPDDILFFRKTYEDPTWPQEWKDNPNLITHVGIFGGSGNFYHRPTSSRPVEMAHLMGYWETKLLCGLRWSGVAPAKTHRELKWNMHTDKSQTLVNMTPGGPLVASNASFHLSNSGNELVINLKGRKLVWATLHLGFEDN